VLGLAPLLLVGAAIGFQSDGQAIREEQQDTALQIQYLEIVTPMVDETCGALSETHGVEFGDPIAELGNARTADLADGGRIGVRAPMRETEEPVVRPYLLVDDIDAAVKAAEKAGAEIAIPPMEIPGQGKFSIYILGGIDHGLWQR
jgi:hypothetical protein